MGKRFVRVREADKRAAELHLMFREVEQMPLIEIRILDDHKTIFVGDRNDKEKWWTYTIDGFLGLNVEEAKEGGGTAMALRMSRRKPCRPRIPQTEIDDAVTEFLSGEEDSATIP